MHLRRESLLFSNHMYSVVGCFRRLPEFQGPPTFHLNACSNRSQELTRFSTNSKLCISQQLQAKIFPTFKMKSAFFLATGAILAAAMPLDKRALETQWVTDIVTVTVTVDPSAPSSAGGVFIQAVSSQPAAAPTPQVQAPAPKPVYAAPPPPVSSPKPAPPPPSPAPAAPETTTVVVPVVQAPKSPAPAPSPEVAAKPSPKPSPSPSPSPAASPKPAASPAASSSSSSSGATDYQSAMVNEHNIHRANHSAPALEWDDQLAGFAQITASGCVFAHDM